MNFKRGNIKHLLTKTTNASRSHKVSPAMYLIGNVYTSFHEGFFERPFFSWLLLSKSLAAAKGARTYFPVSMLCARKSTFQTCDISAAILTQCMRHLKWKVVRLTHLSKLALKKISMMMGKSLAKPSQIVFILLWCNWVQDLSKSPEWWGTQRELTWWTFFVFVFSIQSPHT